MANCYRLQVRQTEAARALEANKIDDANGIYVDVELLDPVEQPWYPRIVAGNGKVVYTGETMHNRSDAAGSLAKLVMAIQSGEFRYEFPDG